MKINFSPRDIFEQEFKTGLRGYDKKEVDEFLDDVIKDYETYQAVVKKLKSENQKLKEDLAAITEATPTNVTVANDSMTASSTAASVSNFDLLRRISRLEREVFGKNIVD